MGKFKDTNYITIQGWMISRLNLNSNRLIVYAIIYGMSQDEESEFTGSLTYMENATGASRRTIQRVLDSLCDDGLIIRKETFVRNVMYPTYRHNPKMIGDWGGQNVHTVDKGVERGGQNVAEGVAKMSPNNKENIIKNIIIEGENKEPHGNEAQTSSKTGSITEPTTVSPKRKRKSTKVSDNPPSEEEVIKYATEYCDSVDGHYFYTYYSKLNWVRSDGQPVKNWKSTMVTWHLNNEKKGIKNMKTSTEDEQLKQIADRAKELENEELPF